MGPESSGVYVAPGADASITVEGDVAGRDIIKITDEQRYNVSGLPNPYLGLASYTYAERELYGGREEQIRDAVKRLTTPGSHQVLLFVTGTSGSGKSSFARAGLVPALEQEYGAQRRTVRWTVAWPGQHPLTAMTEAFALLGFGSGSDFKRDATKEVDQPVDSGQVSVLVLDQFEELVTQSDASERDAVYGMLTSLPSFERAHLHVIATLRDDYLQAVFQVPELFEVLKRDGIELRAMSRDELARAISKPLEHVNSRLGLHTRSIRQDLLTRLLDDVGSDASLLPLVQVTLSALWDQPPHLLTGDRYRTLTDELQAMADRVYERDEQGHDRPEAQRDELMGIFLDLVRVSLDDDPHRDVRQTLTRRELLAGRPERAPLVEELVTKRLLSTRIEQRAGESVEVVDIIHETLIRNWTTLRLRINTERSLLQARERFRLSVREWQVHHEQKDYLLQGVQLDAARELQQRNDVALQDETAKRFFDDCVRRAEEVRQAELIEERARSSRLFRRLVLALVALAIAVASTGAAISLFLMVVQQARVGASLQLADEAEKQLAIRPELSILLAQAGLGFSTNDTAIAAFRRMLLQSAVRLQIPLNAGTPTAMELSPDGSLLALAAPDGTIQMLDTHSGETRYQLSGAIVSTLQFSQDGRRILVADGNGSIRVWSFSSPGQLSRSFEETIAGLSDAALSVDGSRIIAVSRDGAAHVWNAQTGTLEANLSASGAASQMPTVRLDRSGRRIAIGGPTSVRIWNLDSNDVVTVSGRLATAGAVFDPAGRYIVTRDSNGAARVWDSATGVQVVSVGGGTDSVGQVIFSPASSQILTVSEAGPARTWDATTGQSVDQLPGTAMSVTPPAMNQDGSRVVLAGPNYDALVWDLTSGVTVDLRGHSRDVVAVRLSADGSTVATIGLDRMIRVWDANAGRDALSLAGHMDFVSGVDMLGPGRLETASFDGTLRSWSLGAGPGSTSMRRLPVGIVSVAVSPNYQRVAAGLRDGRTWLVRIDEESMTGSQLGPGELELTGQGSYVNTVAFSPDGLRLAAASEDGTCQLWDTQSGRNIAALASPGAAFTTVAFDPRGRWLATGDARGAVWVWDARTLQPVRELKGLAKRVNRVAFAPDGQLLLAGGKDDHAEVWSVESGTERARLTGHADEILSVRFSPSGQLALTTGGKGDRTGRVWETSSWQPIATLRAGNREFNDGVFSQDETQIVIGSGDAHAYVFSREAFQPLDELETLVPARALRSPAELTAAEREQYVPRLKIFGFGF